MDQITLGRTGMVVSRMGLGGGGQSRLGQQHGRTVEQSIQIVRRALDRGINFIDTAEGYDTEEIIGQAIRERDRASIVLSTKKSMYTQTTVTPQDLRAGLEQSLRRLGTEYVDVYHLHALRPSQYDYAIQLLVPEMLKLKQQGKIRAVGVTEGFNSDPGHAMLSRAMRDDCWDVIMVGFNILNQSARQRVLSRAIEKNVGVLCMFAVRAALSRPERLRQIIAGLIAEGRLDPAMIQDADDPLGFVVRDGAATSVVDAAYRFCRDEPGIHVVLSGTGNIEHLEQNIASMQRPPLPADVRARLVRMFEGIDTISGQ
ncbi:aldo/keto reductase [Fontivita pretiosa]|uniref:aldo/keto reductase n=1 Tax=Fontivita pretiosa TaxID=2989684 RepID=UPI003D176994